ncbi:elongator complex protein 3 [Patescibacteria group bacterium]
MTDTPTEAIREIMKRRVPDRDALFAVVREVSSGLRRPMPPVRELLAAYRAAVRRDSSLRDRRLESFLVKNRVRSLSGVAVVTVLTKPFPCPGRCVYCPTDRRLPKSYLPDEPAAMRALAKGFDPQAQVTQRLSALVANGHPADKIELIVKGGTWSSYPRGYQREFVRRCFDACSDFAAWRRRESATLRDAHRRNERAGHRIIGLTLETRPDSVTPEEIAHLRELGCTRIELGVQSLDDKRLRLIRRGHDTAAVRRATRLLKDAGYKTDYHLMPQLPGATPASDLRELREVFADPDYRPDMLKIYPCTVIEGTELHRWWKEGRYRPYPNGRLLDVLVRAKADVPRYCRLSRIIRDIPSPDIVAGNRNTSLRQVVSREMAERGLRCACLRCREVGRQPELLGAQPVAFDDTYESAGGEERFLSLEDESRTAVFAFCRLRLPGGQESLYERIPEIRGAAFIRELHTYGHLVPIDTRRRGAAQHRGHGKRLMAEAERIAREAGFERMAVISGVGVRGYYRKLGYRLRGTYMVKRLV